MAAFHWLGVRLRFGLGFRDRTLLTWLLPVAGVVGTLPTLQMEYLLELVVAMLGLGALRSFEKMRGVVAR